MALCSVEWFLSGAGGYRDEKAPGLYSLLISGNGIQDMAGIGVQLVITESLMKAKETEYAGYTNVLTFRQFCDEIVVPGRRIWV